MTRTLFIAAALCVLAAPALADDDPFASSTRQVRVTTPDGRALAEGTLAQVRQGDLLQVTLTYRFKDGRQVQERAELSVSPQVVQHNWSWEERQGATLVRRYFVDFDRGQAGAMKPDDQGKMKTWVANVHSAPGRTFAGIGFVYAIAPDVANMRELKRKAVGFIPRPVEADVQILPGTGDARSLGSDDLVGVTVHPNLGFLAKMIANPKDDYLWLDSGGRFTQSLAPVVEPGDPEVRVIVQP